MAQFLRPDADVSAGAWTSSPLWSKLDEAVASDVDFVTSNNNTSPDTFEVALSDPGGTPDAGTVTLRVRRSKSATGGHALAERFSLYQGASLIQELAQATPDSTTWATVSLAITNRAAITDWSDLRVRVSREGATGGSGATRRSLRCSFIELEAPDNVAVPVVGSGSSVAAAGTADGAGAVPISAEGGGVAPSGLVVGSGGAQAISASGAIVASAAAIAGDGDVTVSAAGALVAITGQAAGSAMAVNGGVGASVTVSAAASGSGSVVVTVDGAALAPAAAAGGAAVAVIDGGGVTIPAGAIATGGGNIGTPASTGGGSVVASASSAAGSASVSVDGGGSPAAATASLAGAASVLVDAAGALVVAAPGAVGLGDVVGTPVAPLRYPLGMAIADGPCYAVTITRRAKPRATIARTT